MLTRGTWISNYGKKHMFAILKRVLIVLEVKVKVSKQKRKSAQNVTSFKHKIFGLVVNTLQPQSLLADRC